MSRDQMRDVALLLWGLVGFLLGVLFLSLEPALFGG